MTLKQEENEIDVRKAVKTSKGTLVFEGELSPEELDLVVGVGLTYLFEHGVSFTMPEWPEDVNTIDFIEGPETKQ